LVGGRGVGGIVGGALVRRSLEMDRPKQAKQGALDGVCHCVCSAENVSALGTLLIYTPCTNEMDDGRFKDGESFAAE
jgi:hypothetical protein